MPSRYHFAFWNLENLFDVEHSPRRNEKLERAIGRDLVGWNQALLDQLLANKNLLRDDSPIRILPETATIERFPEMVSQGKYPSPIPFGGMGKPVNQNGFSDHFPVSVVIEESD